MIAHYITLEKNLRNLSVFHSGCMLNVTIFGLSYCDDIFLS